MPLLYTRLGSAQAAVDQTTDVLIQHVARFEEVAEQLLANLGTSKLDGNRELQDFVIGCRFYCSGNLVWRYGRSLLRENLLSSCTHFHVCVLILRRDSLKTQRYGIGCEDMSCGLKICLG